MEGEPREIELVIKSVTGGKSKLKVMNNSSILALKEKIKEIKGVDVENQKIICRGKHLTNGKNLTDFKVKENDCLILMVLKKVSFR